MIRAYHESDIDQVMSVFLASTIPGQAFLSEDFWRSEAEVIRDQVMPAAEVWVVEVDGEVVAFTALLGDLIGGLFTHPQHQGRGHGRALVEHAHRLHQPVRVEVFRANSAALAFYRSRGFVEESSSIDEVTGLEAVIMRLSDD